MTWTAQITTKGPLGEPVETLTITDGEKVLSVTDIEKASAPNQIDEAATVLRRGGTGVVLLLGGVALHAEGLALAHRAWTDWVRGPMITANDTWERVTAREAAMAEGDHETMVSHIVSAFFQGKVEEREEREIDAMWE